jgi:hypothetical protein
MAGGNPSSLYYWLDALEPDRSETVDFDTAKIDEAVLALLYLGGTTMIVPGRASTGMR